MNHTQILPFEFPSDIEGFKELIREFSDCGKSVMVAGRKPNGSYTYAVYFWDPSDCEYEGSGYWCSCDSGGSYGDYASARYEGLSMLDALAT